MCGDDDEAVVAVGVVALEDMCERSSVGPGLTTFNDSVEELRRCASSLDFEPAESS